MHSLAQFVNGILDASLPDPGTRLSTLVSSVARGKAEACPGRDLAQQTAGSSARCLQPGRKLSGWCLHMEMYLWAADALRKTLTESKTSLLKWFRGGSFKLCLKHPQKLSSPSEKQKYCFKSTDLWQPFFSPRNKRGQNMLQYNVFAVPVWGYAAHH